MLSKKRNIILFGVLLIGIVLWQFGFFYRFNYLTAQMDIMRDESRIVITDTTMSPNADPIAYTGLNNEHGFHEHYAENVTQPQLCGIKSYNAQIEKYLIKRNGKNWQEEYQSQLDILINDYAKYKQ